ncbi:Gfo/Idh/MocA family protein [Alteribacillus sp. YIM 98480]|uniref:Gfo/Idh/MocA family protein n=1 Tax=Alteribacillus sp. YIM 98480 TaxID=2606599 RepID=UPI00131B600E|nr:Gfo/Idh/MocA family oxidoreductase [Alteribacillus sp. YIM 98480]
MNKIKIGVAGVGIMGQNHCKTLQLMINDVEFVGVYDKDIQKCSEVGNKFNVKSFNNYEDLLVNVDAVIIATPTTFHYSLIKIAINKNKNILVEKPFVTSLKESEDIKLLLKGKKLIFQVGHIERFNPAFQNLYKAVTPKNMLAIEARRLGQVQRNIDIDVILNLMIHDIDAVLALVNSPLKKIAADGRAVVNKEELDIVYAVLSFENGIIANLVANRVSKEKARLLTITEYDKVFKADCLTRNLYIYQGINSTSENSLPYKKESIIEKVLVPRNEPLHSEILHFVQSIHMNKAPLIGIHEAGKSLEVALKIKELVSTKMKN